MSFRSENLQRRIKSRSVPVVPHFFTVCFLICIYYKIFLNHLVVLIIIQKLLFVLNLQLLGYIFKRCFKLSIS